MRMLKKIYEKIVTWLRSESSGNNSHEDAEKAEMIDWTDWSVYEPWTKSDIDPEWDRY